MGPQAEALWTDPTESNYTIQVLCAGGMLKHLDDLGAFQNRKMIQTDMQAFGGISVLV